MPVFNVDKLQSFEDINYYLEKEKVKNELSELALPIIEKASEIFSREVGLHSKDDHVFTLEFTHLVRHTIHKMKGLVEANSAVSKKIEVLDAKCLVLMRGQKTLVDQYCKEYLSLVLKVNNRLISENVQSTEDLTRLVELADILELEPLSVDEMRGKLCLPPSDRLDLRALAYNASAVHIELYREKKAAQKKIAILTENLKVPFLPERKRRAYQAELGLLKYQVEVELSKVNREEYLLHLDRAERIAKKFDLSFDKERPPLIGRDVKLDMAEVRQLGKEIEHQTIFYSSLIRQDFEIQYHNLKRAECFESLNYSVLDKIAASLQGEVDQEKWLFLQLDYLAIQFPFFYRARSYETMRVEYGKLLAANAIYGFIKLSPKQRALQTPWLFTLNSARAVDYVNQVVKKLNANRLVRVKLKKMAREALFALNALISGGIFWKLIKISLSLKFEKFIKICYNYGVELDSNDLV